MTKTRLTPERRTTLWLVAGAGAGVFLAAAGLLEGPGGDRALPSGAVARVNEEPILVEDYERALAALAADRRGPLTREDRRHVLDRLIEEELLVQRGLELGLVRHDGQVRADLTRAVIDSILAAADGSASDDDALHRFYEENAARFVRTGRLRVRQIFFRIGRGEEAEAAAARAEEALRALRAGESFAAVRDRLGDAEIAPVPDAALPPEKLLDYVGPTVLRRLLELEPATWSDPVRSGIGLHVLQVTERTPNERPPFVEIRAQVAAEARRRGGERALREALDRLRAEADVAVREGAP